ncbi:MAG: ABC transporter ATP-binding protein/permease [Oscillospiraceae bacterium]|jgi:ATP-binding cassette subfamily B protein|nr:ABC transporter ATP-binding protein/permease [Oscillospiraceae bacterium]
MNEKGSVNAVPNFGGPGRGGGPGRIYMQPKPKIRDARGTLKRIVGYLMKSRVVMCFAALCAVLSTVITIAGTRLNGYIVDTFIADKNVRMLAAVCLCMAGMYIISVIAVYVQNVIMIRVAQDTSKTLRRDLYNRILRLPLKYFDTNSSGDIMSRLVNDVDNINTAMAQTVVQLITNIVSVTGMLIAMLLLSPVLTLVTLVTTPSVFFMTKFMAKKAQPFFVSQQRELGKLNGHVEEMVSGQKVLRMFGREKRVTEEFDAINRRYASNAIKAQCVSSVIGPISNMINNIGYLIVAVLGGICVIRGFGGITVGVVFSFLLYMKNFTNPINQILQLANTLQLAIASAERVFEAIDEKPETDADGAAETVNLGGDIQLNNIDFYYVEGKPVLHNATITASPGQTIAIVGPTGAGKTTIISLLTGFYDPGGGEILLDGVSSAKISRKALRRSISLVLQDTFLFSDTIRENIRYGRIDASNLDVEQAARRAHAHEFIMQLPKGYDTILADNGQNLSQGQRQLLNISRAVISQAAVLILDEATSSVDTRTEVVIQEALLELMRGKTSFVIAHRLSTIKNADKIVVIDGGRVIEQGTHSELLSADGFYAKMYASQFGNAGIAID